MPRELEGFRENIELLNNRFPNKDMLGVAEVAEFCGVSQDTVRRRIRFNPALNRISKTDLARQITAPSNWR